MLEFVSNKEPYMIGLLVKITLGCDKAYFDCVDFTATQCANGTWNVAITDTTVMDYIDGREAQFQPLVISKHQIDAAPEYTYTP